MNHDTKIEKDNIDPHSINMEIITNKSDDKHTQARLKYLLEMGKEVNLTARRPIRTTSWTLVGNVKEGVVFQTIKKYHKIGIGDFDFN